MHRDIQSLVLGAFVANFGVGDVTPCASLSNKHVHVVLEGTCKLRRAAHKEKHTDRVRDRVRASTGGPRLGQVIHAFVRMYAYVHQYICIHGFTIIYTSIRLYIYILESKFAEVCVQLYMYVYLYINGRILMYIPLLGQVTHRYMYIHTRCLCIHIHESRFAEAYTYSINISIYLTRCDWYTCILTYISIYI